MMPLEKLLSMQGAADILDVTKKTLLELVRQGKIAFVNVGTGAERVSRKFRPSDLNRFIQAQFTVCQPPSHNIERAKGRCRTTSSAGAESGGVRAILARQQGGWTKSGRPPSAAPTAGGREAVQIGAQKGCHGETPPEGPGTLGDTGGHAP